MTDNNDPSIEQPAAITAPNEPPAVEPAEPVRRVAPEPARPRSQIPEEPEAFRRWIEIEKLKVDRKRLEYEGIRAEAAHAGAARADAAPEITQLIEAPARGPGLVGAATLVLMVLLAAGIGYLAVQTNMLQRELAQLRAGQTEMTEAMQTLALPKPPEEDRPAPSSWSPNLGSLAQPQPSAPAPAPESAPPAPAPESTAVAPTPVPVTTVTPPAPEAPVLLGTGYTVKIYAPTPGPNKKRLENFMSLLKASGFAVDVSDSAVVQSLSNSIAYHASEATMANKVASLLEAKYPALDFELRASASIPEGAKRLFIMNLTEDAVN